MAQWMITLLEWQTRIKIGGYEKLSALAPMEVVDQGVELLKGFELEKLEFSKQMIEQLLNLF